MASSSSALPRLWVIEALGSSMEVDASILKELIQMTPEITGDMGKNARERVDLRVLDTLASHASVCEKEIDLSKSFENVAMPMLLKRTDGAEMLKTEAIQNLITQKSASLPKCTLKRLEDAILEGNHPVLASFKDKSRLSSSNKAKVVTSINAKNLNDISQNDRGNGNLTPFKRCTGYLENESQNQVVRSHSDYQSLDHDNDTQFQITKKLKPSAHVTDSADRNELQDGLVDELVLDVTNQALENTCCEPNPNCEKMKGRELNKDHEGSSDSDGYHKESLDISTKRRNFLSLDFSSDCTELSFCMKCDKGGDMLVCSGAVCPIVVHQGCLGAAPNFGSSGKFFCPFCSYSRAMSEYLDVKKKASKARKDLKVFFGLENGHRPGDNASKNNQNNQNHGNMQQAEPLTSNRNSSLNIECALGDDVTGLASKEREQSENGHGRKRGSKKSITREQNQHRKGKKHKNHENRGGINFGNKEVVGVEVTLVDDGTSFASKESDKDASDGQNRCNNREMRQVERDPNADVAARSEDEDDLTISEYFMRPRMKEIRYTSPATPHLSRKRVPWTPEEETVLVEGFKKFSGPLDRATKWKQILEFGNHIFQKGRTAVDLKDKWRNISKHHTNL